MSLIGGPELGATQCESAPVAQSWMGHQSVEMTANIKTGATTQDLRDVLNYIVFEL